MDEQYERASGLFNDENCVTICNLPVRTPFCVFDLLATACLFRNREKIVEPLGVFFTDM